MKLKPEIKEKWLSALRSGNYKKCTGVMHRKHYNSGFLWIKPKEEDRYCAMGVLGVIVNNDPETAWDLLDEHTRHKIIKLNDIVYRRGFRRTANWIDKNL